MLAILTPLIPFLGGLGLFIYGMQTMAQGLQNAVGSKMKSLLGMLTNNRVLGILFGAVITAVIQSSSATTVMIVGFVNAGVMNLSQAMGVIMGANIGTTVTGWIVSLGEWADFLKPDILAHMAVMIGVITHMTSKKNKVKDIAIIFVGFGVLFIGIDLMSEAVKPLRDSESFKQMLVSFGNTPILGILAGAIVTVAVQSSSASVGILQTLAGSGLVNTSAAVYIIMGQNIGTCVTALLSSIGATKTAKSAAYMHLLFNVIGSVLFSVLAILYFKFVNVVAGLATIDQTQISMVHTFFNIANTIILFPLGNFIIKMSTKLSGATKEGDVNSEDELALVHLDDRVLETPGLALQSAIKEVSRLGEIVIDNFILSKNAIIDKKEENIKLVFEREKVINRLTDGINDYLVKLSGTQMSEDQHDIVVSLMHIVIDIERVGDHCENIVEISQSLIQNDKAFSGSALTELTRMFDSSFYNFTRAIESLTTKQNEEVLDKCMKLEDQVDAMEKEFKAAHILRMAKNKCDITTGTLFLQLLADIERISDHALNIVQSVIAFENKNTPS